MKTLFLSIALLVLLSTCAYIDSIGDTSQVSTIQSQVNVELVSAKELSVICNKRAAIACYVNDYIYIQGTPSGTYSANITIEYLSWADLGDRCGRLTGTSSCYENNTLYTSSTYTLNNIYNVGIIGDLLADVLDISDIGFNRRTQLGHEFMHLLGKNNE